MEINFLIFNFKWGWNWHYYFFLQKKPLTFIYLQEVSSKAIEERKIHLSCEKFPTLGARGSSSMVWKTTKEKCSERDTVLFEMIPCSVQNRWILSSISFFWKKMTNYNQFLRVQAKEYLLSLGWNSLEIGRKIWWWLV